MAQNPPLLKLSGKISVLFFNYLWFGIFLFQAIDGNAQQKQAQVWKYGVGNTLDFGFSPVKRFNGPGGYDLGAASICDSNGRHLFGFMGSRFFDKFDKKVPSGPLDDNPKFGSGQSGCNIIIPFLKDKNKFHIFSIRKFVQGAGGSLYSFIADMRLNKGLGDIDTNNFEIIGKKHGAQLACFLHDNERDTWLVSRLGTSDTLVSYLITDSGAVKQVKSKTNSPALNPNLRIDLTTAAGYPAYDSQLKSSPDSKLLLVPRRTKEYAFHELYQFNKETGEISNRMVIADTTGNFFLNSFSDGCFSSDSKKLYISTGTRLEENVINKDGPGAFWQYDVSNYDSAAIAYTKVYLGTWGRSNPNTPMYGTFAPRLQLAIDGKIYISPGARNRDMSQINCPNSAGKACRLVLRSVFLDNGRNGSFFPTLNQTFVRNAGIFQLQANKRNLCQGDTLELSAYGAGAEKFRWSVSPALPQTVKVDTLTWQKIDTRNIPAGAYTFSCHGSSRCGDQYDTSIIVKINPNPVPDSAISLPGGKGTPCIGDSVFVKVLNPQVGYKYFWSMGDTSASIVVKQTGRYSLDSVSNAFGCGIKVSDTVSVVIKDLPKPPPPIFATPLVRSICEGTKTTLSIVNSQLSIKNVWSDGQEGDSVNVGIGKYSAFSQSVEGCASSASDTIQVNLRTIPAPVLLSPKVNEVCIGEKTKLKVQSSGHKVVWSDGQPGDSILVGSGQFTVFSKTDEGCQSVPSDTVRVLEIPIPQPVFINIDSVLSRESLQNQNYCVQGLPGSKFSFFVQGGTVVDSSEGCVTVNWSVSPSGARGPVIGARELLAHPPCTGFVYQNFTYQPSLTIPTLVTPNGDGKNDAFEIEDLEYYNSHSLQILNRWGKKVLDTDRYRNDWQGEIGLYFYSLVVDGQQFSGWVLVEK